MYRLLRRCPAPGDDRGFTLLVAIAVAAVGISLAATVVGLAVSTGNSSGVDRQRTVAIAAAESGIDRVLALMAVPTVGQESLFPCSQTLPPVTVWSHPDKVTVAVTVAYTIQATTPPTSIASSGCLANNQRPVSATIKATATMERAIGSARAQSRTMQSDVTFPGGPVSPGFTYSVFSDSDLLADGSGYIRASPTADIYVRTGLECKGSWRTEGSVIAPQGKFTTDESCSIGGDVEARDDISLNKSTLVQGNVTSTDGKVELQNSVRIDGDATAAGSISNSGSVGGRRRANMTNIPDPVTQPLPYIGSPPAGTEWSGFARVPVTSCSSLPSLMRGAAQDTVFYGNCKVELTGSQAIALKNDVALLFTGGYKIDGSIAIQNTGAVPAKLWMIEPSGPTVRPTNWNGTNCATKNGIETGGSLAIQVTAFFYTCGTVKFGGSLNLTGQVYAGKVEGLGSLALTSQLTPPLVASASTSSGPYVVGNVNKREARLP